MISVLKKLTKIETLMAERNVDAPAIQLSPVYNVKQNDHMLTLQVILFTDILKCQQQEEKESFLLK